MQLKNERPHILLCGEKKAGKTTLIRKLLETWDGPVYGFITKQEPPDANGVRKIYMYSASLPADKQEKTKNNLIGRFDNTHREIFKDVFETLGTGLIKEARPDGILVMDELGFMEAEAGNFTKAVLEALQKDTPVLAAVKARYDVPFLNAIRKAEKARLYMIDVHSGDELFQILSEEYPFSRK